MKASRTYIGLLFPSGHAYSRLLAEGVLRQRLPNKNWTILEFPVTEPGRCPLPEGGVRLDAVVTWTEPRDRWMLDLVDQGTRVVNCGMEWVGTEDIASVHVDHDELQQLVISHLKPLKIRNLVSMGHRLALRPASRRICENLVHRAREAGMSGQVWSLEGEGSPALAPERLLRADTERDLSAFLGTLELPAAVCCASDQMAFIVSEVATRLGLRIPRDLAIVGQGDNLLAASSSPPLTTLAGNALAVGAAAGRLLSEWLASGRMPENPVTVPGGRLIVRESTTGKSESAAIEIARRMISAGAVRGISLGELVAASGLSTKTLVRHYRAAFGVDPVEEIQRLRLEEAKRLLASGRLKVVEVAAACGFSSQAAFNNYFRRHTGSSPGAFTPGGGRITTRSSPRGSSDPPR